MLIRIVKLTFKPENIPSFERVFDESKNGILAFQGCNMVELYQDIKDPCIFFTYSFWDKEADLENYRQSDFFKAVWGNTKILFADKPEAWSVNKIQSTNPS
ncbi:putative quinol monooxygenase [Flagellimonas zhangzhouensis]|uniref:Quinol monooxygenase YgiN n=1 Tax=Flagellimonas zhangzhouensis TaxID=1073328 RepID=A0A1H2SZG4_9FLAO|nr:antibiotic biosynthesis monooxygenase family protein [Allomuricauda zhangzhouensis]SDQ81639.1 Quinol monooxygenase YgiN [Allomuricauda zhangzhouensis]SDW36982.1 Quinol monooxygenase YgiN [Allomuricauda zhangzhouensis]